MLLRPSPARLAAFLPLLLHPRRFSDASRALRRDLRAGHGPIRPELIERVSRLLVLGRYDALHDLSLDFSDQLLNSLLRTSRLHPQACLEVFNLASKQQTFRPDYKSYCKMVHILSRARMYDQTRAYLSELVGLNHSCFVIWDELVRVYKSFHFSPTVFDMVLKVYAEKSLVKEALHVFDNIGSVGRVPSLLSCNSLLSNLVKKGEYFVALLVYDQMVSLGVSPDVFTCGIVVNAYCRNGEVEKGVEFAKEMESEFGLEMNVVVYNSLVNGYAMIGDVEGVRRVLGLMSDKGVIKNVVTYTSLVKCYCKKGLMEEAEKVFESVEEADQRVYGVLIDGYCRCGRVSDAVRVHDDMLRKGVRTNATICNSLINGYCKAGELVEAERMFMRMKDPDHYTYNTLVDGYCRAGRVNEALKLCDRMCEKEVVPTVMTYNTLLKGFTRVGAYHDVVSLWKTMIKRGVSGNEISCSTLLEALFKLGDFDEAMKLWENVLARGLLTDTVTLNVMISGLCKMEKVNKAKEILDSVKTFRCKPDVQTYQALSHGYYKVGNFKEAFGVKDHMESNGMFPTVEMYNTLISAAFKLCEHGKGELTDLVTELRARGLTPTVATYGALITGWCNIGTMDKAYATCFEMIEKGIAVNVNICSKIATSLFRLDKIDEACLLLHKLVDFDLLLPGYHSFKEFLEPGATTCVKTQRIADSLPKKLLVPNNIVYNVALAGLCKARKVKEARKLFSELILREGFTPDEYTYTILIHGCAVDGEINEAFNLRDEMSVKGITPNVVTYNALIKGLCKSGNVDRAQRLLRKLPQKGITPNAITYNTLIDGLMKSGRLDEAMRLKDKMIEKGLVRGGSCNKLNEVLDPVSKSGFTGVTEVDSDELYDVRIVSGVYV
ncbi:hypothetical protein YC2023_101166 [Brassica napus]